MSNGRIINRDGNEYFDPENGESPLGLGLQVTPNSMTLATDTLAMSQPLLSKRDALERILRDDWTDGVQEFDESFTTYQNGFGSCAGYAVASAGTKTIVQQGFPRIDLSGDYQYSRVNGGRDNGSGLKENMDSFMANGCATTQTVKLGEIYRNKYDTAKADVEAALFRGWELFATPDEQSIITALAMKMKVIIAIHVDRNWRKFDSRGMLRENNGVGNHCEHLDAIRYNDRAGRFEFRKATSHGKNYGEGGYCWVTFEDNLKTASRYHVFYALGAMRLSSRLNILGENNFDINPEPEPAQDLSIVCYTSNSCGWCTKWKSEVAPLAVQNGWKIEYRNTSIQSEREGFPGGGVPFFKINVFGNVVDRRGFISWQELQNMTTVR